MIRTLILGASGFVGGELLRLCAAHPAISPVRLIGDSKAGASLAEVHPNLAMQFPNLGIEALGDASFDDVDLVFAALPHGHSQRIAGAILDRGIALVDLGADFRLSSADNYSRWYKEEHQAEELIGHFVYGIPELHRNRIRGARAVAAAGCYPTAAILALKPLIDGGLAANDGIIVDAASGVSGAGRALKESTAFTSVEGAMTAYGLIDHRHTAEMEQELGARLLFTPHLAPMSRGILATCYAQAAREMARGDPLAMLADHYSDEPFVHVVADPPSTKAVTGSNAVHLTARYDARTGRVLAIAAIDNLVKGAAGQMIQCANLMLGLDETAGLPVAGLQP